MKQMEKGKKIMDTAQKVNEATKAFESMSRMSRWARSIQGPGQRDGSSMDVTKREIQTGNSLDNGECVGESKYRVPL